MDLTRRNDRFFGLSPLFDSFFNDSLFKGALDVPRETWSPRIDFLEQENQYIVEVEAPGIHKDDLNLTVEGDQLIISGTKSSQREIKRDTDKYYRCESYVGSFSRSIRIPPSVMDDQISARMNNGILIVTLPKSPGSISKEIEID